MEISPITATSPIDGRYRNKTEELADYFSEYALFKYRVKVEIEYFIALCELPLPGLEDFESSHFDKLRNIYKDFSPEDAESIKQIEKTTNHDVKAVEYFIKECFDEFGLVAFKEFIHFGLTSQDINNTAVPLSLKMHIKLCYFQLLKNWSTKLTFWLMNGRTYPCLPELMASLPPLLNWEKRFMCLPKEWRINWIC